MNKPIFALSVLSAFLLGVLAGPWLRPVSSSPPPAAAPAPPPPAPAAPKSILPPPPSEPAAELQLKGVLAGEDPARSRALIAYGDSSPKLYKVDEKLPDGSVLKSVSNKGVEVEKAGQARTLPLTRGSGSAAELEALTPDEVVPAPPPETPASPAPPASAPAPAEAPAPEPAPTPPATEPGSAPP